MGQAPRTLELADNVARASSTTESYTVTPSGRTGLIIVWDVTVNAGPDHQVVEIYGVDDVSGEEYLILESGTVDTVTTTVLRVRPGIAAVSNVAAADVLPHTVNVKITHSTADAVTGTLSAILTD